MGADKLRVFFLIAIILATASTASGASRILAFVHGNDLYEGCQDRNPECVSYVTGLADMSEMVAQRLTNICRPPAVTIEQLVDVLMSWLKANPAERHRPAATLAGIAFAEAWPCDK